MIVEKYLEKISKISRDKKTEYNYLRELAVIIVEAAEDIREDIRIRSKEFEKITETIKKKANENCMNGSIKVIKLAHELMSTRSEWDMK